MDKIIPLQLEIPQQASNTQTWGQLVGSSLSLSAAICSEQHPHPVIIITPDMLTANQLADEIDFFTDRLLKPLIFPDWEILPYDQFSPHQDIISQRLYTLYRLPMLTHEVLIIPINTLMHRLLPKQHLLRHSFIVKHHDTIDLNKLTHQLDHAGYQLVSQVMLHGEYAKRGSIIDLFPMGAMNPFRIDLFGDEVDSLRIFDIDTQRTISTVEEIRLLPAHEYSLTDDAITHFRQAWRTHFSGDPSECPIYQNVSEGKPIAGIEYYLPLFFENTSSLLDYLPENSLIMQVGDIHHMATEFWTEISERYEQLRYDKTRPLLPPNEIIFPVDNLFAKFKDFPQVILHHEFVSKKSTTVTNYNVSSIDDISVDHQAKKPFLKLANWLNKHNGRVLFCAETAGRREVLIDMLSDQEIALTVYQNWQKFLSDEAKLGIVIAPNEDSFYLSDLSISIITEADLFGSQVQQRRLRKQKTHDPENLIRDLTELKIGAPVVHIDHGVGRYLGLERIQTGHFETEFLALKYANNAKLFVPVSSLHLISRYSGMSEENAPLHSLGSKQWEKAKRKAQEKIHDVAAELLDIYAKRALKTGFCFSKPDHKYANFISSFPFEETPDQLRAIEDVINDMTRDHCTDRLICGDVGFGKTEVAIRAAFLAIQDHKQVAILVPTTLLAEQHLHNFQDRFADWPIRIEALSRFRNKKEQDTILTNLASGKIDIIIGTHKLLQPYIKFKDLALLIVDEEHRFGVRQKEKIKSLRAEVDLITLTATPIPRTLNMALANIRDLSIISTPPAKRLSVKTFVHEYNSRLIREAIMREILRGGQVYFLHNKVNSIDQMAREILKIVPEARLAIAHGQMREKELEKIMTDFYHQRINVLLSTTIIESGIDIPTANTIIINRADLFGLSQLHQLRGRVGRSHHQAYAYLLTPHDREITKDAQKRIDTIASLEELGAGFMLATHDLEIRGAGELLGDVQSGHIQEIGYSLYTELLDKTVKAMQKGEQLDIEKQLHRTTEVDLRVAALIPDIYIDDVHTRLVIYKRIASAKTEAELKELQVELIDRFGLLPEQVKNLFTITKIKLRADPLDIRKIDATSNFISVEFDANPNINVAKLIKLVQQHTNTHQLISNQKVRIKLADDEIRTKYQVIENFMLAVKV